MSAIRGTLVALAGGPMAAKVVAKWATQTRVEAVVQPAFDHSQTETLLQLLVVAAAAPTSLKAALVDFPGVAMPRGATTVMDTWTAKVQRKVPAVLVAANTTPRATATPMAHFFKVEWPESVVAVEAATTAAGLVAEASLATTRGLHLVVGAVAGWTPRGSFLEHQRRTNPDTFQPIPMIGEMEMVTQR
jgi:hypothetical protein